VAESDFSEWVHTIIIKHPIIGQACACEYNANQNNNRRMDEFND